MREPSIASNALSDFAGLDAKLGSLLATTNPIVDGHHFQALNPPSAVTIDPVMKLAAGLARKDTTAAISAGLP